jgi:hypothetical protein
VCAIDPVFSRLHEALALLQGFSLTIPKVQAEYDKVRMDIKVLVVVVTFQEGETAHVDSLSLEDYYVTRASLRQFLEGEILSFTIIDRLVSLVAMNGGTIAMDAVIWAAGRFVLRPIVKAEASAAERGNTRIYKPLPDSRPLAVASMESRAVLDLVNEKRSRLKCKTGGEEAAINWGYDVLKQFRQLRSSTGEGSELRASLGTRSFSPFFESWEPVSDRYKDLLEFCDMIACNLPTTSAFEADFSPLRGAKTVYRANLSCLGLEGVM